jgi:hypothetical protein
MHGLQIAIRPLDQLGAGQAILIAEFEGSFGEGPAFFGSGL